MLPGVGDVGEAALVVVGGLAARGGAEDGGEGRQSFMGGVWARSEKGDVAPILTGGVGQRRT